MPEPTLFVPPTRDPTVADAAEFHERFTYTHSDPDTQARSDSIRDEATIFAMLLSTTAPNSYDQFRAFSLLDQAVQAANDAITPPIVRPYPQPETTP